MAIVNSKPMRRVGVGAQYICFWEKEQTDNQIAFAANVTKLKTVASIQTTEERSESKVFGSNEVYDVDTSVTPPKMTVENFTPKNGGGKSGVPADRPCDDARE